MSNRDRQIDMILRHMREQGSITQREALQDYGIARLASRINDIRKTGVPVQTVIETARNRYGVPVHYARYQLGGRP